MIGVVPKLRCPALRGDACPPIPSYYCPLFALKQFFCRLGMSKAPFLAQVSRVAMLIDVLHMSEEEVLG